MATASPAPARPRTLDRYNDTPSWWRRVDVVLIGSALAIALSGLLMIFSATAHGPGVDGYTGFVLRQAAWVTLGLAVMAAAAAVDYRRLRKWAPSLFALATFVLLLVLTPLGSESKGAQAWFQLGGFQFQPSEFAKVALIVCLAGYCARQRRALEGRHVGFAVALAGVPISFILLQPDLGTALVFAAIAFVVLLAAGASARALGVLVGGVVVVAFAVIQLGVLQQYQLDRLGAFLDPNSQTQTGAYNLNQSKIAIGSGGLTGKGLFLGSQTNLRFVPEQHTDFIFTVVGEELGFLGAGTLLALFAILMWRVWQAAREATDPFGALLCTGVLAMLAFQVFQNVGMTMGIMPITGIPLPLVSYGGSSTIAVFLALGLVLGVRMRSAR